MHRIRLSWTPSLVLACSVLLPLTANSIAEQMPHFP